METVNYKDLVAIGFPEHTSRNIIRQAKKIAVKIPFPTPNIGIKRIINNIAAIPSIIKVYLKIVRK